MDVVILQEQAKDYDEVYELVKAAFAEAEHADHDEQELAVLPEYQRKGVGGRLIEAGHRAAQEIGFKSVLLVGHSTYYPRFGYQPAQRFGITTNLELPPDVFMACELVEGGFSGVTGRMALAPEFQLEMD